MHFINVLDRFANDMKLVTDCLKVRAYSATSLVLRFISYKSFLSLSSRAFRMMVEHSFQRELNVTCSRETNEDNNNFLGERGVGVREAIDRLLFMPNILC